MRFSCFFCFSCFAKTLTRWRGALPTGALLAGALLAGAVPVPAEALYRFDDLLPPSGMGTQWMVVTADMNTGGSPAVTPMETIGNLVEHRSPIRLLNGGINGGDILSMFLVMPETTGNMLVNFDVTTPPGDLPTVPSYTQDVEADLRPGYLTIKTPLSDTSGPKKLFKLDFTKSSTAYESVKGFFIFHQNPDLEPSQTLNVPFVIANVHNGTAEGNPLLFRTTIRDARIGSTAVSGVGNMAAYDRFTWNVVADKTGVAEDEWLFVPISKLPIDSNTVNYHMTTEVTNYTSLRYALQRYDGYGGWGLIYPARWAFDLPGDSDLPANVYLDELSHIPPGLVTTYTQSYNVVSGFKDILRLYPVDAPEQQAPRTLSLAHRSIFGLDLGTATDSANPASYAVTGFNLLAAGTGFLEKVGDAMGTSNAAMPDQSDAVISGAVSYAYIAGDVITSVAIDSTVPVRMRNAAILPLHVTFNLPRSNQLVAPRWADLLREWRTTGDIRGPFANSFSIYLQDAYGDNLDMLKWLQKEGYYNKTVKVFLDEQRNVITVSFIVLLMDGPRATVRVVEDATPVTRHSYIAVMDGNANGKWDMKFYAAPEGYIPTDESAPPSGGGGCGVTLGAALALLCVPLIFKRR